MDVKSRREEYSQTTHAAIVRAAIERFTADGFAGASMDAIAESARVTKGAVYHHFKDKADLFQAAFALLEERLLANVGSALAGIEDPWELFRAGVDRFLIECCEEDFRRIALEEAPAALGWRRWKEIEERYFLALVKAGLDGLATNGQIRLPPGDLAARMILAAAGEAGTAVARADDPDIAREQNTELVVDFVRGLR